MVPNENRFKEEFDPFAGAVEMRRRRESDERAAIVDRAPELAGKGGREGQATIGQGVEHSDHGIEPLAEARDADGPVAGEKR